MKMLSELLSAMLDGLGKIVSPTSGDAAWDNYLNSRRKTNQPASNEEESSFRA
jgi:hypothetical protein